MTLEEYVLWMQAIVLTAVAVGIALALLVGFVRVAIAAAQEEVFGLFFLFCAATGFAAWIAVAHFWPF